MIIYFLILVIAQALWMALRTSPLQPIIEYGVLALVCVGAYLMFDPSWIWMIAMAITFRAGIHDVVVNGMEGRPITYRNGGFTDWIDAMVPINPSWMKVIYFVIAVAVAVAYYITH